MIKISHRGNIKGVNPELENTPEYIDNALLLADMCEVDVWMIDKELYLSHDYPKEEHKISEDFLSERRTRLIIHCKNIESLIYFQSQFGVYHYFWHQEDNYTLTSYGWIWAYPNITVSEKCLSIAVMPEEGMDLSNFSGVCADNIIDYL